MLRHSGVDAGRWLARRLITECGLTSRHGHGPILTEENEPYFHHEWERRVFPLFASLFVDGHFNVDEFRHAIERMDPAHYLEGSYYEHWLHAFETLLLEKGVISATELQGTTTPAPAAAGTAVLTKDMVQMVVSTGGSARVGYDIAASFKVGDIVRLTISIRPRIPAYPAMCAAKSAGSKPITASSSRRTPRLTDWANILSTSTA